MIYVKIKRNERLTGKEYWQDYQVPLNCEDNHSVLGVLHFIYKNLDDTLGYSYSCRFERCGLCAMVINKKASLACITPSCEQLEIEPLKNLPVVRDLVIDRRFLINELRKYRLVPNLTKTKENDFAKVNIAKDYQVLMKCRECLCCVSACLNYEYHNEYFGGPFLFVKIAQLAYRENNLEDLVPLVTELGIKGCRECGKCICPVGLPIFKSAIEPFLHLIE